MIPQMVRKVSGALLLLYIGTILGLFIAHKAQDARQKMQSISEQEVVDLTQEFLNKPLDLGRKTYQQITEEANRTVGKDCYGTTSGLSPAAQVKRINEILGTPNPPPLGRE